MALCVNCSVASNSATPWTVVRQAPLSMKFSRQEHWSVLPLTSQADLPDPGVEPRLSPTLQADPLLSEPPGGTGAKESTCQCRRWRFNPWVRKIHWKRKWPSTPVFLPGESHGQRSLVGCSIMGHKESNTTEQLSSLTI